MPNSLQSSAIASPASRRATNCSLSSITEHSFQGITPSPLRGESVTYVSGTMCYLCLRPLSSANVYAGFHGSSSTAKCTERLFPTFSQLVGRAAAPGFDFAELGDEAVSQDLTDIGAA